MSKHSPSERNHAAFLRTLLGAAGLEVAASADAGGERPDLEVRAQGRPFALELKATTENRVEVLLGLMAAALLQARRHATRLGATALPMVGVANLTDRSIATVAEFMAREAPEAAWGMWDLHGRLVLRGLPGGEIATSDERPRRSRGLVPHDRDPFSDLGQWMAKVLLARRLPPDLLAAPRVPVHRARDLARLAGVSEPTSARWVKLMRAAGFLDVVKGELRIVRARDFLERWQRKCSSQARREVPTRFILPAGRPNAKLELELAKLAFETTIPFDPEDPPRYERQVRWKSGPRASMALFEASGALGFPFVDGAPVHLYLDTVDDDSLRRLGLERVAAEQARVRIIQPRCPESVFRGVVMRHTRAGNLVPSADVIQTWLDVFDHPARGREQADEIERDMLAKWLFSESSLGSRP